MNTLSKVALNIADFLRADIPNASSTNKRTPEQDKAMKLLQSLYSKYIKSPESFKIAYNISVDDFFSRISNLVLEPFLLNQGGYGICAPATFLYVIIKDFPVQFVTSAFELLQTGNCKIGNLKVNPSSDFKKINFPMVIMSDVAMKRLDTYQADYLLLGALRDSRNLVLDVVFDKKIIIEDKDGIMNNIVEISLEFIRFLLFESDETYTGYNPDIEFWFNETGYYKPIVYKKALSVGPEILLNDACHQNETILIDVYTTGSIYSFLNTKLDKKGGHICTMQTKELTFKSDGKNMMFLVVSWGVIVEVACTREEFKKAFMGHFEVNRK